VAKKTYFCAVSIEKQQKNEKNTLSLSCSCAVFIGVL
jgi:hypothetical protein